MGLPPPLEVQKKNNFLWNKTIIFTIENHGPATFCLLNCLVSHDTLEHKLKFYYLKYFFWLRHRHIFCLGNRFLNIWGRLLSSKWLLATQLLRNIWFDQNHTKFWLFTSSLVSQSQYEQMRGQIRAKKLSSFRKKYIKIFHILDPKVG